MVTKEDALQELRELKEKVEEWKSHTKEEIDKIHQQVEDAVKVAEEERHRAAEFEKKVQLLRVEVQVARPLLELIEATARKVSNPSASSVNEEALIQKVLQRIPSGGNAQFITVEPQVFLKKKFQEEEKQRLLAKWSSFDEGEKKIVRYLLAAGKGVPLAEVGKAVFGLATGSFNNKKWLPGWKKDNIEPLAGYVYDDAKHGRVRYVLRETVPSDLAPLDASEEEAQAIIQHIEYEITKDVK